MSIFYYDDTLARLEQQFLWDRSLAYLEKRFKIKQEAGILNSLIGFSWFYLIEGPIISRKYNDDPNNNALAIWRKYIDIGSQIAADDPYQLFISGYTLSLHGFYISNYYERRGYVFMRKSNTLTDDPQLKQITDNFLLNQDRKVYKHLENGGFVCKQLFNGKSLLDAYFREIYEPVKKVCK